jgi:hypothetical protein
MLRLALEESGLPLTDAALPLWAEAVAIRLRFFARDGTDEALAAFRRSVSGPDGARMLGRFLRACLDLIEERAARADLAEHRDDLVLLCGLVRTALAGDLDDRPLLARTRALMDAPGPVAWVACVPGRVVWLAAMAASVPDEEGAAAVMLVNDLAAADAALPLRAIAATAG